MSQGYKTVNTVNPFGSVIPGMKYTLVKAAVFAMSVVSLAYGEVSISEVEHTFETRTVSAYRIENSVQAVTIVPERGGRIVEWIDKRDGANLVHLDDKKAAPGGLLDDHDTRTVLPYSFEIVEDTPELVSVRLGVDDDDGMSYEKTVTVRADTPVIEVRYDLANTSQSPRRMLFRNIIVPDGVACDRTEEMYCMPTTDGIVCRRKGFGRTDNVGAPWMALINEPQQRAVATVFEGDVLRRFYSWMGSVNWPTYEYLLRPLDPGETYEVTLYWKIIHGLDSVDHSNRDIDIKLAQSGEPDGLQLEATLHASSADLTELTVTNRYLDANRREIGSETQQLEELTVGQTATLNFTGPDTPPDDFIIVEQTITSRGNPVAAWEKPFVLNPDADTSTYQREVRWNGSTEINRVEGWRPQPTYTVKPSDDDFQRGYVVYEQYGDRAGETINEVDLDLAVNEPETFALFLYPLQEIGPVNVKATLPDGVPTDAVTTFAGEQVTFDRWGETHHGWKLPVSDQLVCPPEEESAVWIRLHTKNWQPGTYVVPVMLEPADAEAHEVAVHITVHPVYFPDRTPFKIHAHTMIENLYMARVDDPWSEAAVPERWNIELGEKYFRDLASHGNQVAVSYGGSGIGYSAWNYILDHAGLRGTEMTLRDAIESSPEQFRTESLPDLDYSHWNTLFDAAIRHGFTTYRTSLGHPGGVHEKFIEVSRVIWGDDISTDDPRHLAVNRWLQRQATNYLRDRGYRTIMAVIGDEIPEDKYDAYIQSAELAQQAGILPGVTQSNLLLTDEEHLRQMAPWYEYAVIGTIDRELLHQRLREGVFQPKWLETYVSSACYWRTYGYQRAAAGWSPGYLGLDACWIQVYFRWKQTEAIIFPSDEGPITTAAWEGTRDGFDDANYYQLVQVMIGHLRNRDPEEADSYQQKLDQVLSYQSDALIHAEKQKKRMGDITVVTTRREIDRMREAQRRLLDMMVELNSLLGHRPGTLWYGDRKVIDGGEATFRIAANSYPQHEQQLYAGLQALLPDMTRSDDQNTPNQIVLAQWSDLAGSNNAELAELTGDLSPSYPRAGEYVIRDAGRDENGQWVIALIGGDEAGLHKAIENWLRFIEYDRLDYSHWFTGQQQP